MTPTLQINPYLIPGMSNKHVLRQITLVGLPELIITAVCMSYNVSLEELKQKKRDRALVDARSVIMTVLRIYGEMSLQKIATIFLKDHCTVLFSINKVKNLYQVDREFKEKFQNILRATNLDINRFERYCF